MRASTMLCLWSLPLLSPTALAETLTVGPAGSGAAFQSLAQAVAAAQAGDVVLVAPGQYNEFSTLVLDEPITILGAGSELTTFSSLPSSPLIPTLPVEVRDIGPGEELRVVGLTLRSVTSQGDASGVLLIRDCAGAVSFADVKAAGGTTIVGNGSVMAVLRSDQVLLDACAFAFTTSLGALPAVVVDQSSVSFNQCSIFGGTPPTSLFGEPVADGAVALSIEDSLVRIARSEIVGGSGSQPGLFGSPSAVTSGAPAIVGHASTVYVRGGTLIEGGRGGVADLGGVPAFGPGAAALELDVASFATATPDATLLAGVDGDGVLTAPVVAGGGPLALLPQALATLGSDSALVAPGANLTLEPGGEPASLYLPFFAFAQTAPLELNGILGTLVVSLTQSAQLPLVALDAAGAASLPVPIPAAPTLVGVTVAVQGFAAGPSGTFSLSAPVLLGLR